MSRFVEGQARNQVTLLPECLDDYIAEDNSVRVVDAFIGELESEFGDHAKIRIPPVKKMFELVAPQ